MKKLILSVAILTCGVSAFALSNNIVSNEAEVVTITMNEEFKEISLDKLSQAIVTTIKKDLPTATVSKAYVNASLTHFLLNLQKPVNSILDRLTTHEINILKLIARQKTSAEIADMLFISPKTVANHRSNISKKLELSGEQNGLLKWAMTNKHILGS